MKGILFNGEQRLLSRMAFLGDQMIYFGYVIIIMCKLVTSFKIIPKFLLRVFNWWSLFMLWFRHGNLSVIKLYCEINEIEKYRLSDFSAIV